MEVRTGRWPVERVVSEIDALERELTAADHEPAPGAG
jgi:hypothetical protein